MRYTVTVERENSAGKMVIGTVTFDGDGDAARLANIHETVRITEPVSNVRLMVAAAMQALRDAEAKIPPSAFTRLPDDTTDAVRHFEVASSQLEAAVIRGERACEATERLCAVIAAAA